MVWTAERRTYLPSRLAATVAFDQETGVHGRSGELSVSHFEWCESEVVSCKC